MINIVIDKPDKLRPMPLSPLSGFITFNYDADVIQYIRNLQVRTYIPETHEWEVPLSSISKICNDLSGFAIQISCETVVEAKKGNILPIQFNFKTEPFTHQLEGILYGMEHDTFLLGDEQGLGKTKQGIDLAVIRKQSGSKHCLIICGVNGLKYNWREEIRTHSREDSWVLGTRYRKRSRKAYEGSSQDKLDDLCGLPEAYFIITNIETLRGLSRKEKKKTIYPMAQKIRDLCRTKQIDMIIFDECHKAKNPASQQGKALLSISAKYMIAMSGTPLMNNPLDLYVPLTWLGYENHSFFQFKKHYCVLGGYGGGDVISYQNLGELRNIVDTVMLRRTKSQVLDLPPKIYTTEYVEMYSDQSKVYEEVKSALRESIDKLQISNNPLAQMIRLRQATGYPGILSTEIVESAKMDRMEDLVDEIVASNGKVIVFSSWEQITSVVKYKLSRYNPAYVTGATLTDDRMIEVNKFQKNPTCKVIIGTIGAMGTGITLTAASYVIFMDSPWNRALKDQAEDRAHRIGTLGTVNIVTLVCKDTIDERIEEVIYKKGKMSDMLIDGKQEVKNKSAFVSYLLS